MTPDDLPTADARLDRLAEQPLDETDERVLAELATLLDELDPVPDDLVSRVQFALALDEVYAEVAQITRVPFDAMAVRSDPVAGTRTESLTFSAARLTAMVTVTPIEGGVRLDGWLAPPAALRVTARMQETTVETHADETGRFSFDALPDGFVQLGFHPTGPDGREDDAALVITPLFHL